jgi:hypothetical protein
MILGSVTLAERRRRSFASSRFAQGTTGRPARSCAMLELLGNLLWPVVIAATTVSIAVALGVFIATRKLD